MEYKQIMLRLKDELKNTDWTKEWKELRVGFWWRWYKQIDFLSNRLPSVYSGVLIGAGNAVYSIILYWRYRRGDDLDFGVDAVFGAVTQQYFMLVALALIAFVPLVPKLLVILINIYDAIVFGLSFLLTNIVIYTVAAFFIDDVPPSAGAVFSTAATVVSICVGFLCFGPLIFDEDLKKISISTERKKVFSHPASWWIIYVLWVEVILIGYTFL